MNFLWPSIFNCKEKEYKRDTEYRARTFGEELEDGTVIDFEEVNSYSDYKKSRNISGRFYYCTVACLFICLPASIIPVIILISYFTKSI